MKKWLLVIAIAGLILIPTTLYLVDSNEDYKPYFEKSTYAVVKVINDTTNDMSKSNIEVENIG